MLSIQVTLGKQWVVIEKDGAKMRVGTFRRPEDGPREIRLTFDGPIEFRIRRDEFEGERMIFTNQRDIQLLREGRKCQTRRRDSDRSWLALLPGRALAIWHDGTELGWTTVVETWRERTDYITPVHVRAEGYESAEDLRAALRRHYGGLPSEVTTIQFAPTIHWHDEKGE